MKVFFFNQINFPLPIPLFNLLFTGDSRLHRFMKFKVNQCMNLILLGETGCLVTFVLPDSLNKVTGYSDIESAIFLACQYVNTRLFRHCWRVLFLFDNWLKSQLNSYQTWGETKVVPSDLYFGSKILFPKELRLLLISTSYLSWYSKAPTTSFPRRRESMVNDEHLNLHVSHLWVG